MLQKILEILSKDSRTLSEIAQELNMDTESLKDKLEILVHLGFLKRIENCSIIQKKGKNENTKKQTYKNHILDRQGCKFCLISEECKVISKSKTGSISGYILTTKGKKYLKSN